MADRIIHWGVLAPGRIAPVFAEAMAVVEGATLSAVASRDITRANAFAERHQIPTAYGDYPSLLADPLIDAVYICNPHPFHYDVVKAALLAGKAVLCEKPLTVTEAEALSLFSIARNQKRLLMEGLWTKYLPVWQAVQQHLSNHTLGDIQTFTASFGFKIARQEQDRLLNRSLGGGVLLDMGIYPLAMALFVGKGTATLDNVEVVLGPTGVDERVSLTLNIGQLTCRVHCSFQEQLDNHCVITGTRGSLVVEAPFWAATHYRLTHHNGQSQRFHLPHDANGFEYQIRAANLAMAQGRTQEPTNNWHHSQQTQQLMDSILGKAGVD